MNLSQEELKEIAKQLKGLDSNIQVQKKEPAKEYKTEAMKKLVSKLEKLTKEEKMQISFMEIGSAIDEEAKAVYDEITVKLLKPLLDKEETCPRAPISKEQLEQTRIIMNEAIQTKPIHNMQQLITACKEVAQKKK